MPKVSVIIPIYNVEKYLERCLDSVLGQTFQDFEVICVNDGSPDSCGKILKKYAQKDKRIKIISQTNQGLSISRNNGLKKAIGKFICFIDSDDTIDSNFLEKLYSNVIKTNSDVVIAETRYIKTNKIKQDHFQEKLLTTFKEKMDYMPHGGCCNKLYKREFLIKNTLFFPKGLYWEDNPVTVKVCYYSNQISVINGTCYNYYSNSSGIVHNPEKSEKRKSDSLKILTLILDFLKDKKCSNEDIQSAIKFSLKHFISRQALTDRQFCNDFEQIAGIGLKELGYLRHKKFAFFKKVISFLVKWRNHYA